MWWIEFSRSWNGSSLWAPDPPSLSCYTDASGKWGCGAILSTAPQAWFQLQWPESWKNINIATKETVPIVIAAAIWGSNWRGCRVLFESDNTATVAAIRSGSAKDPLLRCVFFFAASWDCEYTATRIPGATNVIADALSRDKAHVLAHLAPTASTVPSLIPLSLQDLLFHTEASWTSAYWRERFTTYIATASQEIHPGHITQQLADT